VGPAGGLVQGGEALEARGSAVSGAKLGLDGSPNKTVPTRLGVAGCDENSQHLGDRR
jgi:hypothetical protein